MAQPQSRKKKILGDVKRARRRRALLSTLIVAVIAIGIVAAVILLSKPPPGSPLIGAPISALTSDQLTGVSASTLQSVGPGTGVTPLATVGGSPLMSGGKNEFLYIGADYCPYCAAERWSIIVALSKFGNFTGLTYMESSPTDKFPNTATFSFYGSQYHPQYNISFVSVETQDRLQQNTLQQISPDEQTLMNKYNPGNSIPFIDIAGQYLIQPPPSSPGVYAGSQYSPGLLSGLNWTQIGSQLNNPSSGIAQAVDGAANTIIKAVCQVDGGNPSSICSLTLAPPTQAPFSGSGNQSSGLNIFATTGTNSEGLSWRNSLRHI